MTLMLHKGGSLTSLNYIATTRTPSPKGMWHPIPHITFINLVLQTLTALKFAVEREQHALSHEDNRYFGLIELRSTTQDYCTTIGLRNSHDMTFGAELLLGSRVFVCDNLAFSGRIRASRKHTTNILKDLPLVVDNAVGKLLSHEHAMQTQIENYKATELDTITVDHLLMNALRAQVIPGSTLPKILHEYHHPRHAEFTSNGQTAWTLFNACTEFMKNNLSDLPRRSMALHTLFDAACRPVLEGELA